MTSDSKESMLAPWMTPGVNSPLLRFTAKTSMRRVYDVRSPWRAKNENQSGGEPQTAQEPLRTRPDLTGPRCLNLFASATLRWCTTGTRTPTDLVLSGLLL